MSLIKVGDRLRKEFIFIHIPKTGGTSIKNIIGETGSHLTIGEIIKKGEDELGTKFNINKSLPLVYFVRNPFDKLVSAYHYVLETEKNKLPEVFNTFDDFVCSFLPLIDPYNYFYPMKRHGVMVPPENANKINKIDPNAIIARHILMWQCQTSFVQSREDIMHYWYKFETIELGFQHFMETFVGQHIDVKLPHLNKRKDKRKPYQEYYKNKRTYEIVCDFYNHDFINFDYSKKI